MALTPRQRRYIRTQIKNAKPNSAQDLANLGFVGASQLAKARANYQGHVRQVRARAATAKQTALGTYRRQASQNFKDYRAGKIDLDELHKRNEGLDIVGGAAQPGILGRQVKEASLGLGDIGAGFGAKLLGNLGKDIVGLPAGIYQGARHPVRAAKMMGASFKESVTHPVRQFQNAPDQFLLNLSALGSGGVGAVGKAAEIGRAGSLAEAGRIAIRPRAAKVRGMEINGVKAVGFGSRNPLTQKLFAKTVDKRNRAKLAQVDERGNVGTARAKFGRLLSRQYQSQLAHESAAANALGRFAHTGRTIAGVGKSTKLTPEELKAAEIIGHGHDAESFIAGHAQAARNAAARGDTAAAQAHIEQGVLAGGALHLVNNPSPNLQAFLDEARPVVAKREKDLGMSEDEVAHAIGIKHDEISALNREQKSLGERIAAEKDAVEAAREHGHEALAQHHQGNLDALHAQAITLGKEAIGKGAFYIPSKAFKEMVGRPPAAFKSVGPFGLGPPRIPKLKANTGANFRSGAYRSDIVHLLVEASKHATKVKMARDVAWPTLQKLAHDTREAAGGEKYAIPVRATKTITPAQRKFLASTEKDIPGHYDRQIEELKRHILPEHVDIDYEHNVVRGTNDPVKWVDSRAVGGLLTKGGGGTIKMGGKDVSIGGALDTLNALPRAATLYAKPSYAWNRVQQFLQNVSQQGVFMPLNHSLLHKVQTELPVQDYYRLKAAVDTGRSKSLIPKGGKGKAAIESAANWWSKVTDDTSRELSWIHEARRAGFDTPEKIHELLNAEGERGMLARQHISNRANNEAIPFGKASELEKQTIGRLFFFYPWMRASAEFSARFPLEHPLQAAAGAQLGSAGYADTQKKLGGVLPQWAHGLVPLTGGKTPLTSNFSNLNTFQTLADVGEVAKSLKEKPGQAVGTTLASEFGPIGAAGYGLATGTQRGRGSMPPWKAALMGALSSTPPLTFSQRLSDSSAKTYKGGITSALGGYLGGGQVPRPTRISALRKSGLREMPTEARNITELQDKFQKAGIGKPSPEVLAELKLKLELEHETRGKEPQEKVKLVMRLYDKKFGTNLSEQLHIINDAQANAVMDQLRPRLYGQYLAYKRVAEQRIASGVGSGNK